MAPRYQSLPVDRSDPGRQLTTGRSAGSCHPEQFDRTRPRTSERTQGGSQSHHYCRSDAWRLGRAVDATDNADKVRGQSLLDLGATLLVDLPMRDLAASGPHGDVGRQLLKVPGGSGPGAGQNVRESEGDTRLPGARHAVVPPLGNGDVRYLHQRSAMGEV
jgi:hypothetical protein